MRQGTYQVVEPDAATLRRLTLTLDFYEQSTNNNIFWILGCSSLAGER